MALFRLVVVVAALLVLGAWASQATAHTLRHVNKFTNGLSPRQRRQQSTDAETAYDEQYRIHNAVNFERPSSKSRESEITKPMDRFRTKPNSPFSKPIGMFNQPSPFSKPIGMFRTKPNSPFSKPSDMFKSLETPVAEQPAPVNWGLPPQMP
ncbi:uncharacterized protein LOC116032797 [Ipomoea triloba]|uniref:uncharacterized protein LOC116032797 n=1 Tax=Ipomoea triloba TaxID=35885 RepID=UPI00125CF94D|nr:uncharacterized protein LOC116032797 [Ipomoea triloba]